MSPSPTDPASALPDDSPVERLKRKIRFLCLRILRGQHARRRKEVYWYFALRVAAIILAALTATGLIADKVSGNITVLTGWAFWSALVVLAFGILVQIADVFGVERVATHARVLSAMCDRYETELGIILSEEDPIDSVNELSERVNNTILDPNNHATLAHESDVRGEADRLADALITQYLGNWNLPALSPKGKRK